MSDDGQSGLVVIAFVGSVFSPYYARALRKGAADPEEHCAINVALYGKGGHHWAMTERSKRYLKRDETHFGLGPSSLGWDGTTLTITIQERTTPFLTRMAGTIRFIPDRLLNQRFDLDAAGRHQWHPVAPSGRISVQMDHPAQSWTGHGYLDSNVGTRPITEDFTAWDWSRAQTSAGPVMFYDVMRRDGTALNLALGQGRDGALVSRSAPPPHLLKRTLWRVPRYARSDPSQRPKVALTLEDTPFYTRSLVVSQIDGEEVAMMHESLSLDRLRQRWVETLLPFRMPRLK